MVKAVKKALTEERVIELIDAAIAQLKEDLRVARQEAKANRIENKIERKLNRKQRLETKVDVVQTREPRAPEEYNGIKLLIDGKEVEVPNSSKYLLEMLIPTKD